MTRIGLDFGKTIAVTDSLPFYHSFETIKHIVCKYGIENVFIISKAREKMRKDILKWFKTYNFFKKTGIIKNNVFFVREYVDKVTLVKKMNINVFIDDHFKVISRLVELEIIFKVIWFNEKGNIRLIPKTLRKKVVISNKWNRISKIISKID